MARNKTGLPRPCRAAVLAGLLLAADSAVAGDGGVLSWSDSLVGLGAGTALGLALPRRRRPRQDPETASAALRHKLVECASDPIYMLDMADGFRMVFANEACCRHYGLDQEALYRLRLPDWDPNFTMADLEGLCERIRRQPGLFLESCHRLPDGRTIPVEVSAKYLVHEDREYVAGQFRDISARKAYEAALRDSENQLRASADHLRNILDNIGSAIYVKDTSYRYELANKRVRELFGQDEEHILGATDEAFFDAATVARVRAVDRRVLEDGETVTTEDSNQFLADGGVAFFISVKIPLRDAGGRIYGVLGISTDISERKRAEDALRASETRFRYMADAAPVLIWLADTEKLCTWFNQVWLSFTGRTLAQESGHGWAEGVHPEDFERCLEIYVSHFDARLPFRMEYRLRRYDGIWRWILDTGQPLFQEDGTFAGYIGSCIDITDHKEAEESLSRSRRELAAVVGSMDDIILEVDRDLRFRNCWGSDDQKLFLPPEGFMGRSLEEVFGPEFARPFAEAIRQVLAGAPPQLIEYASPMPGDPRWFSCRIAQLRQEDDGVTGVILAIGDITERWKMESALRVSERRLEERSRELDTIFNLSPDGFIAFDDTQTIKYASPAGLRLLAAGSGSLIGMGVAEFARHLAGQSQAASQREMLDWLLHQCDAGADEAASGEPLVMDLVSPYRVLEARARRTPSESVSVILYFHDITERMEVDRMKSDFLSTAAHELRTPMASIYGFTELLLLDAAQDEDSRRDMLGIIYRQAKLVVALVNELLDLARIEARRGKDFVFATVDLGSLVREALAAGPDHSNWQGTLSVEVPGEPVLVWADANKLRQALSNVLSNAYKYSPGNGPIRVSLKQSEGEVGVEICDSGIGMTEAERARVCERFFRADTSGAIPGTGLGMSIVQEIVTLHQGRLMIESAPGRGTAVTIWLRDAKSGEF